MVYVAILVTHVRLLISITTMHVGFTFHCRQTTGVYPSCAPPLLCQLNNRIFETCSLNVWDCFLSNFTSTAAGRTECRSAKQFTSALSLHAWGELTAKSNTLFAGSDSSHPENLGGGTGFASSSNTYLSGCKGHFDSSWGPHLHSLMIDGQPRPPVCLWHYVT